MTSEDRTARANRVILGAAALFLLDLFLPWQRVEMRMPAAIDIRDTASGWSGWGALAGVCAIALLVVVIAVRETPAIPALALGVLLCTTLEVLAGNAHVTVNAAMMRTQVDTTLWPAWVGLALAGATAAAAAVPYLATPGERRPPTAPVPHGRG
jgi:hypothetical protein